MHCERCEELQEEIRQLRNDIAGSSTDHLEFCDRYRMTPFEARIFQALHNNIGKWVSQKILVNVNPTNSRVDYPDPWNTLKVRVCKIRRKTRNEFRITCRWGEAYKLERITNDTPQLPISAECAA